MGKLSRRDRPNRGLYNQSSPPSLYNMPELLSMAEDTSARLHAFEEGVAAFVSSFESYLCTIHQFPRE